MEVKEEAKDDGNAELVEVTYLPPSDPMPLDEFGDPIEMRIPAGVKLPKKVSPEFSAAFQKSNVCSLQLMYLNDL